MAAEALKVLRAAPKDNESFYDREAELNKLVDFVAGGINRILVLLGPTNSGKSHVLKRMEELFRDSEVLRAMFPLFRIDMRLSDYKTPQLAATAIVTKLRAWAVWFKNLGVFVLKSKIGGNVTVDLSKLVDGVPEGNLAAVMAAFQRLAYASPDMRPIFIIDEVDKLKMWEAEDVKILMDGFVAMTKQDERATIILSSSDDFFRGWFKCYVSVHQWKALGVGYFSEEDAKCYFSRMLPSSSSANGSLQENEWKQIFRVCGGNPLALRNCADDVYKYGEDLESVLEGMVGSFDDTVRAGLCGDLEKDGWDGAKFRSVMELIVKRVAVRWTELETSGVFGSPSDCRAQLKAMVKQKLIHVRFLPKYVVYDDLERENTSVDTDYIMATTPAHWIAMERHVPAEASA